MKLLKKNQVIIYVIAVMLMVAGYLNYTTRTADETVQASSQVNETDEYANIGDARLVSSEAVEENTTSETNATENQVAENTNTTNETTNKSK